MSPEYMKSRFFGAQAKLERARVHINEIEAIAEELARTKGVELMLLVDQNTGQFQIFIPAMTDFAARMAPSIGDAVHNLFSALDIAAVSLSTAPIGTGDPGKIHFPTGETKEDFLRYRDGFYKNGQRKPDKKRPMNGAPQSALDLVESLQPFEGGEHLIRGLRDLDVQDKHRLLIPSITFVQVTRLDVHFENERKSLLENDFTISRDENITVAAFDFPGASLHGLKYGGAFHAKFDVVFVSNSELGGRPVVSTLNRIASSVEMFIKNCLKEFGSAWP